MDQKCKRAVIAPALVLLAASRPAPGANGFSGRKPLQDGLEAAGEIDKESAPRLRSVSGMEVQLSGCLCGNLEAERELNEIFGVPLSVRAMPGSKKEGYKELELDFDEE